MQMKSLSLTKLNLGKQKDLTEEKKSAIVRCVAEGIKSTEIAKELCLDHRNVKIFIANPNATRKRCDKGVKWTISRRQKSAIKREAVKLSIHTPLTTRHRNQRLEWAKEYVKTDFETVLFTDERRATLDGPDGWCRSWLVSACSKPSRVRRQQGGDDGVMLWAWINGNELVGPFRVPDGVKMNIY